MYASSVTPANGGPPERDRPPEASSATANNGPSARLARAATGVLVLGAIASLAALAVTLGEYQKFVARGHLPWYFVFGAITAFLGWCAFRLRPTTRVIVASTGTLGAFLLFTTEVVLGLAAPAQQARVTQKVSERTGVPIDRRTVSEVVAGLRNSGVPAVPSVVPVVLLKQSGPLPNAATAWTGTMLPLAGLAHRPTVQLCNESGQFTQYDSDRHGFANPDAVWSQSTIDLALIGDSFTHGYCVDLELGYAGAIRARWPSTLNLGTGGSGPLAELATLTEFLPPLAPRTVVWQYFENDLADLSLEKQHEVLMSYLVPAFSQRLQSRQREVDDEVLRWLDRLSARGIGDDLILSFNWRQALRLYQLRSASAALFGGSRSAAPASLDLFRQVLLQARDRVAAWGGRMVFVFVPAWERYYNSGAFGDDDERRAVLSIARNLDLYVVDLEPLVREGLARHPLYARHELANAHFNAAGYRLMADAVSRAIGDDRVPVIAQQ